MFFRNIIHEFRSWAADEHRKPLILRGARQVGKTTAVKIFGKEFDHFIHLNLEHSEDAELFTHNLGVGELLQAIYLSKNLEAPEGKILLFIDEIQNAPPAMAILRYFYESKPEIYLIGAGSLLESMLGKEQISFPVGRVQYLFLHPVSFDEYLAARGEDQALQHFYNTPVAPFAVEKLFRLFHEYTLIGGMPEVVARYCVGKDITALATVYQGLLTSYMDDVSKYARNATMVACVRHAIESAPYEAGKRITFQGFGNSSYRSREMGEALRTLERVMLVRLLYPSTVIEPPIIPDLKKSPRLQFLDTGLLNYVVGLQGYFFKKLDLHSFYQGRLAEHIVGQELIAGDMTRSRKIVFWVREKRQANAEVDFLLQHERYCIPVEVKAGKAGTLRSLHQFMERAEHSFAVRLYAGPVTRTTPRTPKGKKFTLLSLPYFLAGRLTNYLESEFI